MTGEEAPTADHPLPGGGDLGTEALAVTVAAVARTEETEEVRKEMKNAEVEATRPIQINLEQKLPSVHLKEMIVLEIMTKVSLLYSTLLFIVKYIISFSLQFCVHFSYLSLFAIHSPVTHLALPCVDLHLIHSISLIC